MKTTTPKEDRKTFDKEVERVLAEMSTMHPESPEYLAAANSLKVLREAQGVKSHRELSSDVIVTAAVNILGILLILNHERLNVITTKALGFVSLKGRG